MNSNLTLGILAFLIWSGLSTWYYTCEISGLCFETDLSTEQMAESTSAAALVPKNIEPDSVVTIEKQPALQAINLTEDKIYFNINSTDFLDRPYVDQFVESLLLQIEDRDVQINIIGSTCDLGKANYNLDLGLKRAKVMQVFLNSKNIELSKIAVDTEGEIPSVDDSKEERQRNRRVSINIKSVDQ